MKHNYKFADVVFSISYTYKYLEDKCVDYITAEEAKYEIEITQFDIDFEKKFDQNQIFPDSMLEFSACQRKVSTILANENVILFHSFSLAVDNKGYAFAAPSGTGKTTHGLLWKELLEDRLTIIDGDKPFIRVFDDKAIIYGTPWNGKENLGNNISFNLNKIGIIERSETNSATMVNRDKAKDLIRQIYVPNESKAAALVMKNFIKLINMIPVYVIKCNMSIEAAKIAFDALGGEHEI